VFFQDQFGLITFDDRFQQLASVRPQVGRTHILHTLDVYGKSVMGSVAEVAGGRSLSFAIESQLRRASLVPVISDFLFPDVDRVVAELAQLNAVHDVLLLMADVRFAYEMPAVSAGWIEAYDIESGRPRVLSRREMRRMVDRVAEWQDRVARLGRDAGLDVIRVGLDRWEMENTLVAFTAERRLRKIA
jgi:hypothetical protein